MTKSGLSLAPRSASRFSRSSDSRFLQGLASGCMERPESCRHELARLELRMNLGAMCTLLEIRFPVKMGSIASVW